MKVQHQNLAQGKWAELSLVDQMAHIGSEVQRAINWRKKGNLEYSQLAFYRALELIDLSLACQKTFSVLKEIARVREMLVDYFAANNQYQSTNKAWQKYFYAFTYAARNQL